MSIAARSLFWVVTFGTLGYSLFTFVKPDDEVLKKIDQSSRHTDSRRAAKDTISVLREAANPNSDINKKIEELLKK